ncbi:MAG: YceI family protein [Candidatus Acidiferrales bacterium]
MFRGTSTIRAIGASVLLIFALILADGSLSARLTDDSSRYVVKTDSLIEFHASATFAKVAGVFHSWEADLKMPGDKFDDAALVLEIEADSVATGSGAKDKEIKGRNFFFVKENPQIRFVSKSVTSDGEPTKFRMEGELTLRGITQPVSVAIVVRPKEEGHQRIEGQFSFNRREFGMVHNVPFNKVANTVEVNFQLEVQNMAAVAQNVN